MCALKKFCWLIFSCVFWGVTQADEPMLEPGVYRLPPRSVNDITRMLDHYKPDQTVAAKVLATADAPKPSTDDRKVLFEFYRDRAEAAARVGRLSQQIEDLEQAKFYGPGGGASARVMRQLAQAEAQGGNLLTAERYLKEAIANIPQNGMGQLTGGYAQAVNISLALGDMAAAKEYLRQLSSTLVFLRGRPGYLKFGHSWNASYDRASGDIFMQEGKPSEAEAAYRRAISENDLFIGQNPALIAAGEETPSMETLYRVREALLRSLALSLQAQGKIVLAEAINRSVLQDTLKRTGRTSLDVAQGVRQLASIIAEQGRYEESSRLAKVAVETFIQSGAAPNSLQLANARRAYAASLVALRQYGPAIATFNEMQAGLKTDPLLVEKVGGGDLDWVLASLRTGDVAGAEVMAARMLQKTQARLGEKSVRTAEVRAFHAMTLAAKGQQNAALNAFRESVPKLVDQARNDSEAEATTLRRQQRLVTILESYIRLLAEMHAKGESTEGVDAANESFLLADLARGSSVQRALASSAARAAISDPELADLARKEQDTQRRMNSLSDMLGQLLSAPPEQQLTSIQAKLRTDIDVLKGERDKLRADIQKRFPEYAQLVDPKPIGLARLHKLLKPGEALVSWYFGEEGGQVWAVAHGGQQLFAPVALNRSQMAASVTRLRKALSPDVTTIDAIPAFDVAVANDLYEKLLKPALPVLEKSQVLLVVPHAELGQLPLAVLTTAPSAPVAKTAVPFAGYQSVPWLMHKFAVAQLPSVTALASLRGLPAGRADRLPFIGFGDPFFSEEQAKTAQKKAAQTVAMRGVPLKLRSMPQVSGVDSAELALLPRLPDTSEEIREIGKVLGAEESRDLFLNVNASEMKVLNADLSHRKVVMFATHGLIPGDLDGLTQPALALTAPAVAGEQGDGLLTMDEILGLKLNADWVVLSACNTAAGDGSGSEAVSGLGRAFFYAGARALLVSNWPVETRAARLLMTDMFRRQFASTGAVPAKPEALRQAMLALMNGPGSVDDKTGRASFSYAHPLFWAPFVVVGD